MPTNKILDNTVISASVNEIKSINLIAISGSVYSLKISSEVYDEISVGFSRERLETIEKYIEKIDGKKYEKYERLFEYLSKRYPYLHKGDISSVLIAILAYALQGLDYYLVTDDSRLRKKIPEILQLEKVKESLGMEIDRLNYTGTIGLIKRLCEKGVVSPSELENIVYDLKNSTFRVNDELLEELKRCE